MRISHFPNHLPNNSDLVYPQLVSAIEKTDTLVERSWDADAALIWSVLWFGKMSANKKVWDHYRGQGKPIIVIEVGGLRRNETWKLGINGINRDADFAVDVGYDSSRLSLLGLDPQPWHSGEYILICGQHGHSEQWRDMPDMDTYYKNTVTEIRSFSDLPIVIRSHPRFRENLHFAVDMNWYAAQNVEWNVAKQIQKTYDSFDLEHQLRHSYCVISHSSNAGVSAVIAGVPAVVTSHSLAYDVASTNIRELVTPDRHDWLCRMSYMEWRTDEIETQWLRIRSKL